MTKQTYDVMHDDYSETAALQDLLETIETTLRRKSDPQFSITMHGKTIAFVLDMPQAQALCAFMKSLADENSYDIDWRKGTVKGWERYTTQNR